MNMIVPFLVLTVLSPLWLPMLLLIFSFHMAKEMSKHLNDFLNDIARGQP